MDGMGIGEIARRSGLQPSAIRYYESLGLVSRPARAGGKRRYGSAALDELRLVTLAREAGFTVEEVGQLVRGLDGKSPALRWKTLATRKLEELDAQAARLNRMRKVLRHALGCGCPTLADCAPLLGSPEQADCRHKQE